MTYVLIAAAGLDKLAELNSAAFAGLSSEFDKTANQKGANNNNYKGAGKRGYSADHKDAAKKIKAKSCVRCGATKDIQRAVVHGSNGKKFQSMCRSCHAKYDNFSKNLK